jgi:hypothetical protein
VILVAVYLDVLRTRIEEKLRGRAAA